MLMTVGERADYVVRMTLGSLKGGGTVWAYGDGDGAERVPDTSTLRQRLRQAPGVFRASLAAINDENKRRAAGA